MSSTSATDTVSAALREDIHFPSSSLQCAAWHYPAGASRTGAFIVMAHGFGATRDYGLDAYARQFQESGYAVLLFDYRHFGDSDGEPRGLLDVRKQHEDWAAAITYCRSLGYDRIILWGTSFAGGHVLHVAAHRNDIAAVIAQVPHISGPASALSAPIWPLGPLLRLWFAVMIDILLRPFGRRAFVKVFGEPGSAAAMSTPGAYASLIRMLPADPAGKDGMSWRDYFDANNRVTASSLLQVLFYSPGAHADRIRAPVLIQAGRKDRTTPFDPAERAARAIPACDFIAYDIDHFDIYLGNAFDVAIADQLRFLNRLFAA